MYYYQIATTSRQTYVYITNSTHYVYITNSAHVEAGDGNQVQSTADSSEHKDN